jgi:hypothetical protein
MATQLVDLEVNVGKEIIDSGCYAHIVSKDYLISEMFVFSKILTSFQSTWRDMLFFASKYLRTGDFKLLCLHMCWWTSADALDIPHVVEMVLKFLLQRQVAPCAVVLLQYYHDWCCTFSSRRYTFPVVWCKWIT